VSAVVPVVAAGELEDAVAAREPARQPDRAHRRLGARRDEPHLLDRRNGVHELLGKLYLPIGRGPERRPVAGRVHDRVDRLRVGVPEDQRPPGHDPVDVAVAVLVLEVCALTAADEQRLVETDGSHRPHRRVDAAGDHLQRAAVEVRSSAQSHVARSLVQ
jgi:hypothetical protein